jgi:putative endonuclease
MAQHLLDGQRAEELACEYLKTHGYKVIARNFCSRFCEIDIIVHNRSELVFVEVKFRHSSSHGGAISAVGHRKAQQLQFAAQLWLSENPRYDVYGKRIDVIAIEGELANPRLEHIENAVFAEIS